MNLFRLDDHLPWLLPALLLIAASLILGVAWLSELYGANLQLFGNRNLEPCQLCIVQRYPYALMMALSLGAILLARQEMERALLLSVIAVVLFFGTYVSGFHVGVENDWWPAGESCSVSNEPFDLNAQTFIPMVSEDTILMPNCSEAAWRFPSSGGLSMAGFNFFISLAMALGTSVFAYASIRRLPRDA